MEIEHHWAHRLEPTGKSKGAHRHFMSVALGERKDDSMPLSWPATVRLAAEAAIKRRRLQRVTYWVHFSHGNLLIGLTGFKSE